MSKGFSGVKNFDNNDRWSEGDFSPAQDSAFRSRLQHLFRFAFK